MKLLVRVLALTSLMAALSACTTAPKDSAAGEREPADIRGANYFKGTFDCADRQNGLASNFTFGAAIASFSLKGEAVQLSCDNARSASPQLQALFRNEYKQFGDFCMGHSKKGQVVTGTSNSMGAVQMTAILLDQTGKPTAKALLNCESAKSTAPGGW